MVDPEELQPDREAPSPEKPPDISFTVPPTFSLNSSFFIFIFKIKLFKINGQQLHSLYFVFFILPVSGFPHFYLPK